MPPRRIPIPTIYFQGGTPPATVGEQVADQMHQLFYSRRLSIAVPSKMKGVWECMVEHLLHFALHDLQAQVIATVLGNIDLNAILGGFAGQAAIVPEGIDMWRMEKAAWAKGWVFFFSDRARGRTLWQVVDVMEVAYHEFPKLYSLYLWMEIDRHRGTETMRPTVWATHTHTHNILNTHTITRAIARLHGWRQMCVNMNVHNSHVRLDPTGIQTCLHMWHASADMALYLGFSHGMPKNRLRRILLHTRGGAFGHLPFWTSITLLSSL